MTKQEALKVRAIIEKAVQSLDDNIALEVPTLYPFWREGLVYTQGMKVFYEKVLYSVLQTHISQTTWEPDITPSLFAQVLVEPGKILEWVQPQSTNPYKLGDKVLHNEKTWVSIVDNNVWEPGVYGWEEN